MRIKINANFFDGLEGSSLNKGQAEKLCGLCIF